MLCTAWYGDKHHVRGPLLIMNCIIALIGLPIAGFARNPWARYVGVFLAVAAVNSNVPLIMTYQVSRFPNLARTTPATFEALTKMRWKANNIRGQWKRAFCSATLTGIAGVGGVSGALVFRTQDGPEYVPGLIAVMT